MAIQCREIEDLLADALGGELTQAGRAEFDAHIATCSACQEEFRRSQEALEIMRSLPGPMDAQVREFGRAWTIDPAQVSAAMVHGKGGRWRGLLRYAASILIAFTAGYGMHSGFMLWDSGDTQQTPAVAPHAAPGPTVSDTLESALRAARRRGSGQPRLAMCVSALMQSTP